MIWFITFPPTAILFLAPYANFLSATLIRQVSFSSLVLCWRVWWTIVVTTLMDLTTSFKRLIETCDNCQVCLKEWFVNNTEPKVFPIWTNDWANAVSMARAPIELTFLVGQVGLFCHDHVQSLQLGHHASTAPFFPGADSLLIPHQVFDRLELAAQLCSGRRLHSFE